MYKDLDLESPDVKKKKKKYVEANSDEKSTYKSNSQMTYPKSAKQNLPFFKINVPLALSQSEIF